MSEQHRSLGCGGWMRYVITMIAAFLIYTLGFLDNESIKLHPFLGASEIERKYGVQNHPIEKLPEKNWSMTATHNQSVPHKNVNIPLGELEYNSSANTTNSITAYERLHASLECLPLPEPRNLTHPVSVGACCGIGHRLCFNLPTFVWAVQHGYPVSAVWPDVPWSVLFKDFIGIKASTERADEHYDNGYPGHWLEGIPDYPKATMPKPGTSYAQYSKQFPLLFDMPLAQSIVKMLQCNLSVTVLSFLKSIREQSLRSELHLCAHIREGNNETGDWAGKTWRHIDLYHTLNSTLNSMRDMAKLKNTNNVTVFIASDSPNARPWFEEYVESSWTVIRPAKEIKKPESGVWFGEWNSKTNSVLNQEQKNEAMAEAVSDIFALGECDALWIPNYSSFTLISIILTRANRRPGESAL